MSCLLRAHPPLSVPSARESGASRPGCVSLCHFHHSSSLLRKKGLTAAGAALQAGKKRTSQAFVFSKT
jgi:hypothetical protein